MNAAVVLSSIGGAISFMAAVVVVIRAIYKQISATEANTRAVTALADQVQKLGIQVNSHEVDIGILKDRVFR